MSRPLNFLHLTTFYPPYSFGGDAVQIVPAFACAGGERPSRGCGSLRGFLSPVAPGPTTDGICGAPERGAARTTQRLFKGLSPLLTQQTGQPWLKSKSIARGASVAAVRRDSFPQRLAARARGAGD